jgi:hypothetical protein
MSDELNIDIYSQSYDAVLDVKGSLFFGSKSSTNLICYTMPRLAQPVEISRAALFSTSDISLSGFLLMMVVTKNEEC